MQTNNVILQTAAKIVVFIIITFSAFLFFSGHNNPGGGFIGGLMSAGALVLIGLAFGRNMIKKVLPVDFRMMTALGLLIAVFTGIGSFFYGVEFLSHTDFYRELPLLGRTHLATAVIFDLGVYLAVVGVTMTIILSIGEDR